MTEPYTFTHNGVEVLFNRGTVRSGIEARQIMQKLLFAHGFYDGNVAADDIYRLMDEYASCAARSKTEAAWWGHSNMPDEELKRRFEIFLDEDEDLYVELRQANLATRLAQKKNGGYEYLSDAAIVEDFMKRLIAAEKGELSEDDLGEPPGFHHDVNVVMMTWLERKMHGIYPETGGLFAQDMELMEDWVAMSLWQLRVERGVFSAFSVPQNAPAWQGFMGD